MHETLDSIGEKELLNRLKIFMPIGQIDNDTAEIATCGRNIVINTDVLVDGVHFSEMTTSAEDIGWKAISTNYSDLASSGVSEIIGVTVGLVAPPETTWNWVQGVYMGMKEALNTFGGELLGGDCSKGTQKLLSITAIGRSGILKLHRANANPGDYIVVSGAHGLSKLGLALLQAQPKLKTCELPERLKFKAIQAHKRPNPPLNALRELERSRPNNIKYTAACTDSSDGLLEAIYSICTTSQCQAILNKEKLPRCIDWPSGRDWDDWCLNGGEDYELVLSLPKLWALSFTKNFQSSAIIGKIKSGKPKIIWDNGEIIDYETYNSDFKHF